jgi:hypothetical protein
MLLYSVFKDQSFAQWLFGIPPPSLSVVENTGLEPVTSAVQGRRSSN